MSVVINTNYIAEVDSFIWSSRKLNIFFKGEMSPQSLKYLLDPFQVLKGDSTVT